MSQYMQNKIADKVQSKKGLKMQINNDLNLWLSVYTWNVCETDPLSSNDFRRLFELDKETTPDIFAIGLQEIQTGVRETVESFVRYDEWADSFKQLLAKYSYYMIESVRVQGMSLSVFVKSFHLPFVRFVMTDIERTGIAGSFGDKGGVAISANIYGKNVCFMNTHLAAHLKENDERIKDFKEVLREVSFGGKASILSHDVVFWMGDMNFRLDDISRQEVIQHIQKKNFEYLWQFDQLKKNLLEVEEMKGFKEADPLFPPTYKFDPGTDVYDTSEKQRKPAWTDRVLWRIHPEIINHAQQRQQVSIEHITGSYHEVDWCKTSDHKPVKNHMMIKLRGVDNEPLASLNVFGRWTEKDSGQVKIKLNHGMEWDHKDYIAIYPELVEDFRDYKGWVYVPKDLTTELDFPDNQLPDAGRYRVGYYSKNTLSLVAISNVFEIMKA